LQEKGTTRVAGKEKEGPYEKKKSLLFPKKERSRKGKQRKKRGFLPVEEKKKKGLLCRDCKK